MTGDSLADAPPLAVDADRTFVRCLFPFSLVDDGAGFERLLGSMDQTAGWESATFGRPPYVLPHVADFIADKEAEGRPYARGWAMTNDARQRLFKASCVFETTRGGVTWRYSVRVRDATLFAFRSGIGILSLELWPQTEARSEEDERPLSLDGLTRFVRAVRAIRVGDQHRFGFSAGFTPDEGVRYEYRTMDDVIVGVLEETVGEEAAVGEADGAWVAFYEHRLLTFTYALVGSDSDGAAPAFEDVAEPLYRLRHAFDFQYSPSAEDLDEAASEEILRTFENVCVGLSLEGGAMLGLDNGTPFVRDGLAARARGTYFLLFLLTLHQRLGSLHMARRMSDVVRQGPISEYADGTTRSVAALRDEFLEFKLRSWFADVANLTMYSKVYRRWQRVLGVGLVLSEVLSESRELDDYLQRARDERARVRERESDQAWREAEEARRVAAEEEAKRERSQTRLLNVLTLFFLPLTVVGGLLGMNLRGMTEGAAWGWFVAVTAAVYLVVIALLGGLRATSQALRDMRGDTGPEDSDA